MSSSADSRFHVQVVSGNARVHNGHSYATSSIEPTTVRAAPVGDTPDGQLCIPFPIGIPERIIKTLHFDQIDVRRQNLRRPSPETCGWFTKTPEYTKWIDASQFKKHRGFLWVKGKPGAGKTILMNYLYENSRASLPLANAIPFFFNARGNPLERSTLGLYRALLCQLFALFRDLITVLSEFGYTNLDSVERNGWQEKQLQNLLQRAIGKLGDRQIVCYIDALDECPEDEIREMISYFQDISQDASGATSHFSICFSSRHYPNISTKNDLSLTLETRGEHALSIKRYIDSELHIGEPERADEIKDQIVEKASGVFLWVSLVIPMLNKAFDQGKMKALEERLRDLPSKLGNLYHEILFTSAEEVEPGTIQCLQWVLFAQRPLALRELYTAVQLGLEDGDLEAVTVEVMRRSILTISRGLVEETVCGAYTYMQFIHETVHDFLLEKNALQQLQPQQNGNAEGMGHEKLKKVCLRQLHNIGAIVDAASQRRPVYPQPSGHSTQNWRRLSLGSQDSPVYPFLDYAIANVFSHAEKAQLRGVDQLEFMTNFPLGKWIMLNNFLVRAGFTDVVAFDILCHDRVDPSHLVQPTNAKMLCILAERNLHNLVRRHPDRCNYLQVEGGRYRNPLISALACASRAVAYDLGVQALLDQQLPIIVDEYDEQYFRFINPYPDFDPCHPSLFICFVQLDCVTAMKALAQRGENLKQLDSAGKTPLHWAIETNSINAALWLLMTEPANHNVADEHGITPFACACKHLKRKWNGDFDESAVDLCNRMMQIPSIGLEHTDDLGRTPLSYIAESGCLEVAEILVAMLQSMGQADFASGCKEWRSPLSYAAGESKSWHMIELLLACPDASPHTYDIHGRTPLSYAAGAFRANTKIVTSLIDVGHAEVECSDNAGRTPLSYAVESGTLKTIRALLDTGRVVLDSRDVSDRTPISYAAARGSQQILETLISAGSKEVDSRDRLGRTPLSYAAQMGSVETLDVLLGTRGVFADSRDDIGRSPLRWAIESDVLWNVNQKCRLLLKTGQVDIEAKADDGQSPLEAAKKRLHTMKEQVESGSQEHQGGIEVLTACVNLMNTYKESGDVLTSGVSTDLVFRLTSRLTTRRDEYGLLYLYDDN